MPFSSRPRLDPQHVTRAWWGTALLLAVWLAAISLRPAAAQPIPDAVCVDGGLSGRPFAGVNCIETVASLAEAVDGLGPGGLVVVRAFQSDEADSIRGEGTYRDSGLMRVQLLGTEAEPIIIQAEGFTAQGNFVRPIISGGTRVTETWTRTPGTEHSWQVPWSDPPGSFEHSACVDRIWVSRLPGRDQLADFPLTRPMFAQGNNHASDCGDNTFLGQPMTPQHIDAFPGSYQWLDNTLYVHLPGGEDPNQYTIEVPMRHSMTPVRGSTRLIIRGFRVYHTINGIDLWHCGTSPEDRCEATHNEASFNTHFGLQPGRYGLLAWNSGRLNTIQLIKVTSDFSEIAYNVVGPQLAHGFKLNEVRDCLVHHNHVYGNTLTVPNEATQAGWRIIGTRDAVAGIYLKNGTQRCQVHSNTVYHNHIGILLRNDGDTLTEGNRIEGNTIIYNEFAIIFRDQGMWTYNTSDGNSFDWRARFRWGSQEGRLDDYRLATGLDVNPAYRNRP